MATCKLSFEQLSSVLLTLPLLVAGITTDHPDNAFAADDLTVPAHFLDRSAYFHDSGPSLLTWSDPYRHQPGMISSSSSRTAWTSDATESATSCPSLRQQ